MIIFLASLAVFFAIVRSLSSLDTSDYIPPGSPEVVIVTLLDDTLSKSYIDKIKENREYYATQHGKFNAHISLVKMVASKLI